jgi:hypothetical protein
MPRPTRSRPFLTTAVTTGVVVSTIALPGCGDDPSRAAGTIDITAAKAQAARDGQSTEGEGTPKKPSRSPTEGRTIKGGGPAAP